MLSPRDAEAFRPKYTQGTWITMGCMLRNRDALPKGILLEDRKVTDAGRVILALEVKFGS